MSCLRLPRSSVATLALLCCVACSSSKDAPTVAPPPLPKPILELTPGPPRLPTLAIETAGRQPIVSKSVYSTGSMTLTDTAGALLASGPLEIRGRGNTTWELFPKKPYRVKLGTSTALLDMPASRHWVLLANYSDKTLLRNELTFALSRMMGMAWTPRSAFVDLTLNGEYLGIYQLAEHVRIAPERVNITSMKVTDTSATAVTGGYLIEVDERRGETFCFNSTITAMVFCLAEPETLLDPGWERQRAYITGYVAQADSALFGARFADPEVGYAKYIDVASAIDYNIIQEVVKNVDGDLRFSSFLHKPRGGKLVFGPVWDFDLALSNANYYGADQTSGWYSRHAAWYTRLFQDPAFRRRFAARWSELQAAGTLDSLQKLVVARASHLSVVQQRNFVRWPILKTWVWPNTAVMGSYEGEVFLVDLWLRERLAWMNANITP